MKKKTIIGLIISIVSVIAIVGISYAFYVAEINKNHDSTIVFSTKSLALTFTDGPEINLDKALPGQVVIKKFNVQNTGNQKLYYTIKFFEMNNEISSLTYTLTSTNGGFERDRTIISGTSDIIGSTSIDAGVTQEYTMTITYNNYERDQSSEMNKVFKTMIGISDEPPVYGYRRKYNLTADYTALLNVERIEGSTNTTAGGYIADNINSGSTYINNYDHIYPWSDIVTYNYDPVTKTRVADYGDDDFKFDGSNGLVMTHIPEFYYKRYRDETYEYTLISQYPLEGYTRSEPFSVGRYLTSYRDGQLRSESGSHPDTSINIQTLRTLANNLGSEFGILDYHLFFLQMLITSEYGSYRPSNIGTGATGLYRVDSSLSSVVMAEENTNRVISNVASFYFPGMYVGIGNNIYANSSIRRKVISVTPYFENGYSSYELVFDGDPINVDTNMHLYAVPYDNGVNDFLGMKSGALLFNRTPVSYRGIENIWGNSWQYIDGFNSHNNELYFCDDYHQYQNAKYDGCYQRIALDLPTYSGRIVDLGYDTTRPYLNLPNQLFNVNNYVDSFAISSGDNAFMYGGSFTSDSNDSGLYNYIFTVSPTYMEIGMAGSRLLLHEE